MSSKPIFLDEFFQNEFKFLSIPDSVLLVFYLNDKMQEQKVKEACIRYPSLFIVSKPFFKLNKLLKTYTNLVCLIEKAYSKCYRRFLSSVFSFCQTQNCNVSHFALETRGKSYGFFYEITQFLFCVQQIFPISFNDIQIRINKKGQSGSVFVHSRGNDVCAHVVIVESAKCQYCVNYRCFLENGTLIELSNLNNTDYNENWIVPIQEYLNCIGEKNKGVINRQRLKSKIVLSKFESTSTFKSILS